MAIRPCTYCGRRFIGKAQHAYPAVLVQGDEWRRRLSLCPDCFAKITLWSEQNLALVDYENGNDSYDADEGSCVTCHQIPVERAAVFVTLYRADQVRRDFFGEVCKAHRTDAETALGPDILGSTERPL